MSCSIPTNTYPTFDELKAYIDSHVPEILQVYGQPDYDNDLVYRFLVEHTTETPPDPDQRWWLDSYVAYTNCVVREYQLHGTLPTPPQTTVSAVVTVVDPQTAAANLIAPSQYAIPNLYTLRSLDDFYRAFWVAKKGSFETYTLAAGEQFFLDEIRFEVTDYLMALAANNTDVTQMPALSATLPAFAAAMTSGDNLYPYFGVDEAQALLSEAAYLHTGARHEDLDPATAEMLGYLYAYNFAKEAEANEGILPDFAYGNYNPNLSNEDMVSHRGGEAFIIERIQFAIAGMWLEAPDSIRSFLTIPEYPSILFEADVIPYLKAYLGPNATLDDWIKLYNKVYEEFTPWEDAQWQALTDEVPPSNKLDLVEAYEASVAWDLLRQLVYDPAWSPAEEERLLATLLVQINLLPLSIMDVNVYFVRRGLLQYYLLVRNFHKWRLQMKALVDEVETRLMNEDTPAEKLGQVLGVVLGVGSFFLSIFFEPFDWIMSIIDLARGDFSGALFNLLPLIPGAVMKLGRLALKTGGAAFDLGKNLLKRLDDVQKNLDDLETVMSSKRANDDPFEGVALTGKPEYDMTVGQMTRSTEAKALFESWRKKAKTLSESVRNAPDALIASRAEARVRLIIDTFKAGEIFPQRVVQYANNTRYIALLHENIHLAQYAKLKELATLANQKYLKAVEELKQKKIAAGMNSIRAKQEAADELAYMRPMINYNPATLNARGRRLLENELEIEAYQFELAIAQEYGFSSEFTANAVRRLGNHWQLAQTRAFERLYANDANFRAIIDAVRELRGS